jgi:hypothetical protein
MPLDYTQFSAYWFCPWYWWERYVEQRQRRWEGQRGDALTLGGWVHAALERWKREGVAEPTPEAVADLNPTEACATMARRLVEGYLEAYPEDVGRWPMERTEEPLRFALAPGEPFKMWKCPRCWYSRDRSIEFCPKCGISMIIEHEAIIGPRGLAKLDGFFYVPEDTAIPSGWSSQTLTLSRGWWAHEYKTKAYGVDRATWIREWSTKRQADFQIMALGHHLTVNSRTDACDAEVQGVLVSVLEKPYEYTPRRKCETCEETYDFDTYRTAEPPAGAEPPKRPRKRAHGWFGCMVCGTVQELELPEEKPSGRPSYFRVTITRSPEALATARGEILATALVMERLRREGPMSATPNRESCVSNRWHRPCEYESLHTNGQWSREDSGFIQIDTLAYMNSGKVE